MRNDILVIIIAVTVSFFVTEVNAAQQCDTGSDGVRLCTKVADDHSAGWDSLVERPGNIGPTVGVGIPQSPLGTLISAPSETTKCSTLCTSCSSTR